MVVRFQIESSSILSSLADTLGMGWDLTAVQHMVDLGMVAEVRVGQVDLK
jgi:hypothetical protein